MDTTIAVVDLVESDESSAKDDIHLVGESTVGETSGGDPVVQLAASKVALLIGLHEFGDLAETVLEYVYQNREELLVSDATALNLRIVSKDQELGELMAKAGTELAPQLEEILKWTRGKTKPVTQQAAAELLKSVDGLVTQAHGKRKLEKDEAQEVRRRLGERIRLSYGCRNEDLALKTYEKQTGCSVRLSNQEFYFLRFPRLDVCAPSSSSSSGHAVDYHKIEQLIERRVARKQSKRKRRASQRHRAGKPPNAAASDGRDGDLGVQNEAEDDDDAVDDVDECGQPSTPISSSSPFFTICGMIDGVADALVIADDDEWQFVPILLEVKNRVRAFRVPPPLHDYLQMAIYLKMVDVAQGDLIQCLHGDRAQIHVSRVSMSAYPLQCTSTANQSTQGGGGLWAAILLPRLYSVVATIQKLRDNDLLRLAFLNGSETERMEILKREWDFV